MLQQMLLALAQAATQTGSIQQVCLHKSLLVCAASMSACMFDSQQA